ncbi:tRNA (N6-isopentenyl adenosine(37)-C2)-methylthiotransferase MiaB [Tissierella creatinophila]|uniref:tRNA-2-methylthio-N(6)-dimethylallyladenosine synthase n=1 Tax=Tissierella creatinophila DSM 6911 TaxID=1123403 RepID=A0A1U7M9E5_TISCR|nr:tRNA (N6-isopentenyl adenosine(37)-C2)-methylthiotransferase MiaB [Tissierella creatinophila]OLS03964.1 tRNA-2-methylthio-N(6)-dimethylallyladenosine synthase [Tissierella creatinophila DSM 6911]
MKQNNNNNTDKIKKYIVQTYGCQMNEHDSEKISWILEAMGYVLTDDIKECDLIIYNTCAVRKSAEDKVFGKLGELKQEKRKNPDLILAVCGCMMQRQEVVDIITSKYRQVDIIFGTNNIHKLPELVNTHLNTGKTIIDIVEDTKQINENIDANRKYDFKAFVNIMHGCNNFCTYCIVPFTRGREVSRAPQNILEEIKGLADNGCKEVTLLGQNVNSYGKTLEKKYSFPDLLRDINQIDGIERIRFMTSHPKDISDELIDSYGKLDKLCNHLHLPVQSGSNKVLNLMNRKYTKEDYLNVIDKIRKINPDISITTDIIVGFPGEKEEDFEETLNLVKKVKFDSAYTFLYSIREGTPAAKMEDQIPDKIKHNRFQKLLDVLHEIGLKENESLLNKEVSVLVEEISKNHEDTLSGRTSSGKLVHFKGSKRLIGNIVNVKVDNVNTFTLEGTVI